MSSMMTMVPAVRPRRPTCAAAARWRRSPAAAPARCRAPASGTRYSAAPSGARAAPRAAPRRTPASNSSSSVRPTASSRRRRRALRARGSSGRRGRRRSTTSRPSSSDSRMFSLNSRSRSSSSGLQCSCRYSRPFSSAVATWPPTAASSAMSSLLSGSRRLPCVRAPAPRSCRLRARTARSSGCPRRARTRSLRAKRRRQRIVERQRCGRRRAGARPADRVGSAADRPANPVRDDDEVARVPLRRPSISAMRSTASVSTTRATSRSLSRSRSRSLLRSRAKPTSARR